MPLQIIRDDITRVNCDAIVNAANSKLRGGGGVDGAIHKSAGPGLHEECLTLGGCQVGHAKITKGYNLPCKYILHTVGPIVREKLTRQDCDLLASCYHSCLELAGQSDTQSIAFCCISTGEFHFPNDKAAEIAIKTVKDFKRHLHNKIKVIFNVFKDTDYEIYRKLLG